MTGQRGSQRLEHPVETIGSRQRAAHADLQGIDRLTHDGARANDCASAAQMFSGTKHLRFWTERTLMLYFRTPG
jgi:hypothetical protein